MTTHQFYFEFLINFASLGSFHSNSRSIISNEDSKIDEARLGRRRGLGRGSVFKPVKAPYLEQAA